MEVFIKTAVNETCKITEREPSAQEVELDYHRHIRTENDGFNRLLALKPNNCLSNDPCAVCGGRTDPVVGGDLFPADDFQLVCDECARKAALELLEVRDLANKLFRQRMSGMAREIDAVEKDLLRLQRSPAFEAAAARIQERAMEGFVKDLDRMAKGQGRPHAEGGLSTIGRYRVFLTADS
jgi:hypothetical protein